MTRLPADDPAEQAAKADMQSMVADALRGVQAKPGATDERGFLARARARARAQRTRTDVAVVLSKCREMAAWEASSAGASWPERADALAAAIEADDPGAALAVLASAGLSAAGATTARGLSETVLHAAGMRDAPRCVAAFAAAGADVEARDVFKDTPLLSAARKAAPAAVRALLRVGADARAANATASTALHLLCLEESKADAGGADSAPRLLACLEALLAAGADVNAASAADGETPPMYALHSGQLQLLRALLRCPALDWRVRSRAAEPHRGGGLLAAALQPPQRPHACFPTMRQAVVAAAAEIEAARPGAADPDDLFGLRSHPTTPRLADVVQVGPGLRLGKAAPPSDGLGPAPLPPPRGLPRGAPGADLLRPRGRVLRYADGATVVRESEMAPSEFVGAPARARARLARALAAFAASTHPRLGADSPARALAGAPELLRLVAGFARARLPRPWRPCGPACVSRAAGGGARGGGAARPRRAAGRCPCEAARRPCFGGCDPRCVRASPLVPRTPAGEPLSDCARDHAALVAALTPEQRAARVPLACIERRAGKLECMLGGPSCGPGEGPGGARHYHQPGDGGAQLAGLVPVGAILAPSDEACAGCGEDGLSFFSFCLNRVVNADRVKHCLSCGRCFYYRKFCGVGRCPYCDRPASGCEEDSDSDLDEHSEAWRCRCQLASEGAWGH